MDSKCERKLDAFLDTLRDGLRGSIVLAAVSGGADSVALLVLLHRAMIRYGFSLQVVSVNHMIRSEKESAGDAEYVSSLCASLLPAVPCEVVNVAPGEIARLALARGRGLEDAARHVRYSIIARRARETGALFVMTGHTANDQGETRLMRFIQGASGKSLAGVARLSGKYAKPLLSCTHGELCAFLTAAGIVWREDATNSDDRYLRNRIRLHIVPVLDSHFPGWMTGLESGAEKLLLDDDLAQSLVKASWRLSGDGIECSADEYFAMHPAVRLRFLRDGLERLSSCSGVNLPPRVSGGYLMELARMQRADALRDTLPDALSNANRITCARVAASGLVFTVSGDRVFWKSDIVHNTKSGYLVYIRETGTYRFPFGELTVTGDREHAFLDGRIGPFLLPIIVRSRTSGDSVRTADGRHKKLKKLMNDWSIPEDERNRIPIVEREGEIRSVYGSPLGYPDWIVQP